MKNTTTARHIYAEAHNTYDIGQDGTRFKNLFLSAAMKSATITTSGNGSIGAKLEVKSNATDALKITGKARSASTVAGDAATTLVTKDYLESEVGALTGTLKAVQTGGNNSNPNLQLNVNGDTSNVAITGSTGITSTRTSDTNIDIKNDAKLTCDQVSGSNNNPTIALGNTVNGSKTVKVVGGTGVSSTRNNASQLTLAATVQIKCLQTGGNNDNPTISLTDTTGSSKNVTVTGGTGIKSTRTSDTALKIDNDSSITCTQTGGNNTNPYITLGGTVNGTKNVQVVGGTGVTATRNDNGKLTIAVSNDRSPWEVSGGNIRPVTGSQNVVPRSDGNASLGTSSLRWANVYTQDMHFSNEGTEGNSIDGTTGNWTLQEGHDHLYFINNKTGVKFRVVMEQV